MSKSALGTFRRTKRSALSLLFVASLLLVNLVSVNASVGAGGSFASTNYRVQPGNSLIDTGTDFNFVNNFDTVITVDFNFEAPLGVVIVVPEEPVQIAARSTYRIPIVITTTASTPIGTFPLRIVGRVIPNAANGVEVSGSAGLNASITVQGIAPTTPPVFTLISRTQTTFTISITNNDPETVSTLYSLGISPPITGRIDIAPQGSIEVTFTNLTANTIYTVFATATASPRPESSIVSFQATTLSVPVEEPSGSDTTPTTPPPPTPAPIIPPPPSGGGGGPVSINVLVIELASKNINLNVFDAFTRPEMIAYVSIRDNIRETSRIDLTSRVVITGQVDPNVIGRYELRYFLRYNTFTLEEIVVVNVRDTIAPRITSAVEVTIKVDDPFVYQLVATDNYDAPADLIITGFPTVVDTSIVGVQRFNVVVADQSGNRTPILFTVNVRERSITPIAIKLNDVDIVLNAIEGLFDVTNYRIEIAVAENLPFRNSPSWTLFTGQLLMQGDRELVYVRVTDSLGNTLIAAVDLTQGRVIPLDPDANILSGDAWWRVLLRSSNLFLWLGPLFLVVGAWAWFFYFMAKRRRSYTVVFVDAGIEISSQNVLHGNAAIAPNEGPWNISFDRVTSDMRIIRIVPVPAAPIKRARAVKPKVEAAKPVRNRQAIEKAAMIEPMIHEEIAIKTPKPKVPRKPRKAKLEQYAQLVAVEENGVMDDDTLGSERLDLTPRASKDVHDIDLETPPKVAPKVDKGQINLFEPNESIPTKKPKKR
jgi:hypothetical protein